MKIIKDIEELKRTQIDSLAIGTFDGLHLGHQAVIKELLRREHSLVVTFEPHPKEVIGVGSPLSTLSTVNEKVSILEGLGLENLFVLKFSKQLANMNAKKFIHWLVVECAKPEQIVVGYNHHFGCGGEGDFELLVHMGAKFGFQVKRVSPVWVDGFPVSSTRVRNALIKGEVREAGKLLGRQYSILSQVIPGEKRGKNLSYPTANLKVPERKLIPKDGVYAVGVKLEVCPKTQKGMMHIGEKPTFSSGFGLEVHIFDFNKDLLNQELTIEFIDYIRENRAFKSPEALKTQLKKDEQKARKILQFKR